MATINKHEIRKFSSKLYLSSMLAEFNQTNSFKKVEVSTIDAFADESIYPDRFIVNLFFDLVQNLLNSSNQNYEKEIKFLQETRDLCYHIISLRIVRGGDDDRVLATLKVMEYFKQIKRMNAFVRYVRSLENQYLISSLPNQAGLVILLHAELLPLILMKILMKLY